MRGMAFQHVAQIARASPANRARRHTAHRRGRIASSADRPRAHIQRRFLTQRPGGVNALPRRVWDLKPAPRSLGMKASTKLFHQEDLRRRRSFAGRGP
jgi:hypothetical protein